MSKVSIITLGCKQNKYESDCMARILKDAGYDVTDRLESSDIFILNTCAVTSEGEKKSRQYISKINTINPMAHIIVCGCASENNVEQFQDKPNVFSVFGTEGKEKILDYINQSIIHKNTINTSYCSPTNPEKTTTREYLKIQDGCNNFCSYCLIPYLRGRSRSRDIDEIVEEARNLARRSKEIVITGIDISSYKVGDELSLPLLMSRLRDIDSLISLGSLEQGVITEKLMETLIKMPNFSPHFHLSLQSGDAEILKKMNRHYTPDEFYEKVQLIRKYFPLANLTTDVIVGFAGETEEQFNNTMKFIEKVGFSFVHIFPYSKRKGTRAYDFPDLPKNIKKDRVDRLEVVNERLRVEYLSQFVSKVSEVLIEEKKDYYEGFSKEYIRCYLDEEVTPGEKYSITFTELYLDGFKAKLNL